MSELINYTRAVSRIYTYIHGQHYKFWVLCKNVSPDFDNGFFFKILLKTVIPCKTNVTKNFLTLFMMYYYDYKL